jgi:hypothetical protein
MLLFDFSALMDFIIVLFLDRRIWSFSTIYEIIDFKINNNILNFIIFYRLKFHYIIIDLMQGFDLLHIHPMDFVNLLSFYITFLITYFSLWTPIFLFIIFLYFGKINNFLEKQNRLWIYS